MNTLVESRLRVIDALLAALTSEVVQVPSEFAGRNNADYSRVPSMQPLALIRPRTTNEVCVAMRICHAHRQPVVTQGGLTGLSGGACVSAGEIALSLERMRGIEEIDAVSATMTVLAGTPLQVVQEAAANAGFLFALDLGARGSCTVGGNLATNAGGNRVIKYGMMRDQVLDVEAVTADGAVIGGLRKMIKNNTAYDLRHLLVGSEGTLAIMTRAVLKLRPRPNAVSTAFCGLPGYAAVTTLLRRAQAELPAGVSAFEVMWPSYIDFVVEHLSYLRKPLAGDHAFYVIIESTGTDSDGQNAVFQDFLGKLMEEGIISDAALADNEAAAISFWEVRDAPGEFARLLPGRASFDISFSIADVEAAVERLRQDINNHWPAATVLVYGHLGDGNLHLTVQQPDWPASGPDDVKELVYRVTGELNGSISAEHGIGLTRKKYLGLTRSVADIAFMRAIKHAVDPLNLLNPGKVIDASPCP